nr:unnamed protein product [Digitaria exilis]
MLCICTDEQDIKRLCQPHNSRKEPERERAAPARWVDNEPTCMTHEYLEAVEQGGGSLGDAPRCEQRDAEHQGQQREAACAPIRFGGLLGFGPRIPPLFPPLASLGCDCDDNHSGQPPRRLRAAVRDCRCPSSRALSTA